MRFSGIVLSLGLVVSSFGCASRVNEPQDWGRVTNSSPAVVVAEAPLPETPSAAAETQPLALSSQPEDLKVMTFNLRTPFLLDAWNFWSLRRDLVLETIRGFDPDILGTQECPRTSAQFLCDNLPGYEFVGVGRNDGKAGGEMCGMFYKKDRFTKVEEGHFWLSRNPTKIGSKDWGAMAPRIVSWVTLRPTSGGPAFCWFNTHFDNASSKARLESAKLLREAIEDIATGMPVMVTGDFNVDQNTVPYKTLLGSSKTGASSLYDAFRMTNADGRNQGTMHNFHGGKNGDRIDWILTNNFFQPVTCEIDHTQRGPQFPSDHFPVKAVVRMNRVAGTPVAQIE